MKGGEEPNGKRKKGGAISTGRIGFFFFFFTEKEITIYTCIYVYDIYINHNLSLFKLALVV